MKLPYWNHNTAYYKRICRALAGCTHILDIGCGDGLLCRCLDTGARTVTGLDANPACIRSPDEQTSPSLSFVTADFLAWEPTGTFDGIVFCASLHHMDMTSAVEKAVGLLEPGGILYIVGLASPSGFRDLLVEGLRVLPCAVISRLRRIRTCEDNHIPTSYALPSMREVRSLRARLLPGASLQYGLYYRYLLWWRKP